MGCDRGMKQLQSSVAVHSKRSLFTLLRGVCIPLSHFSMAFPRSSMLLAVCPCLGNVYPTAPTVRIPYSPYKLQHTQLHLAIYARKHPDASGSISTHQPGSFSANRGNKSRITCAGELRGRRSLPAVLPCVLLCLVPSAPCCYTNVTETSAPVCLEKLSAHFLTINQAASMPVARVKYSREKENNYTANYKVCCKLSAATSKGLCADVFVTIY